LNFKLSLIPYIVIENKNMDGAAGTERVKDRNEARNRSKGFDTSSANPRDSLTLSERRKIYYCMLEKKIHSEVVGVFPSALCQLLPHACNIEIIALLCKSKIVPKVRFL
jgi:hypothetical protein